MGEKETAVNEDGQGSGMATGRSAPGKGEEQESHVQENPRDGEAARATQDTFKKMKDSVIQNIR